ncbi:MAG: undecaprenyldiphospho-muramoylpentapeptide beta-N-acetylglucosaminyltransferase [Actinomycetota bacterium]
MRVVISGGGTAGHVYPALALAKCLAERFDARIGFVGTATGLEADLVPAAGFDLATIDASPFVRKVSPAAIGAAFTMARSVGRCRPLVRGADVVVGMGGYASGPALSAAVRERRPIVLHEQNAVPGLANRLFSRAARTVALTFDEARARFPRSVRKVLTGNPVRAEIESFHEHAAEWRKEAADTFDLDPGRTTLLVFGGSQGALHVNTAAVGAFQLIRSRSDLQVILVCGRAHFEPTAESLAASGLSGEGDELRVRLIAYLDRMELGYAAADLVIARAGATSIAEITAAGLPSLLVPYPYATGRHQEANARALQRAGAAKVMLDEQLMSETLAVEIERLVGDEAALHAMAERAAAWGKPKAADALAGVVAGAAEGN